MSAGLTDSLIFAKTSEIYDRTRQYLEDVFISVRREVLLHGADRYVSIVVVLEAPGYLGLEFVL